MGNIDPAQATGHKRVSRYLLPRAGPPSRVVGTAAPSAVVLDQHHRLRLLAADPLVLPRLKQPKDLAIPLAAAGQLVLSEIYYPRQDAA